MSDACRIRNAKGDTIREFSLEDLYQEYGTITIGRSSSCVVSLKHESGVDATVGREHIHISEDGGGWWLQESANENKIFKNGHKVKETRVEPGDEVRFGDCTLVFGSPVQETEHILVWEDEQGIRFKQPLCKGENYVGRSPKNHIMIRSEYCAYYQGVLEVSEQGDMTYRDLGLDISWKDVDENKISRTKAGKIELEKPFSLGKIGAVVVPAEHLQQVVQQPDPIEGPSCVGGRKRKVALLLGIAGLAVLGVILGLYLL